MHNKQLANLAPQVTVHKICPPILQRHTYTRLAVYMELIKPRVFEEDNAKSVKTPQCKTQIPTNYP